MDGEAFLIIALLLALYAPEWVERARQWRALRRQLKRDQYARQGKLRQRHIERERECSDILCRLRTAELSNNKEATHATR